jgi:predicted dithiol-disulfide oxidoreductase (DUF899 family)
LLDLFEERRQLIAYRFFHEPGVTGWRRAEKENQEGHPLLAKRTSRSVLAAGAISTARREK